MSARQAGTGEGRDERARELPDALARRVWIEDVRPAVDDGRFPIKRIVGQRVRVTAAVVVDHHERLAVVLRWRPASESRWREQPMSPGLDDVWSAAFPISAQETHLYTVAAWVDRYGSWRDHLLKKLEAGQDVGSELAEGAALLREHAARAAGDDARELAAAADFLAGAAPASERAARAAAPATARLARRHADRSRAVEHDRVLAVDVARPRALQGAWYELFPRSAGADAPPGRRLRAAAERLPAIAELGFDVVYLPPVHPIGRTHRKGPNNSLAAGPDDPGSPWAIGAAEGGHTAVHPDLGTLADFDAFVAAAAASGLEVALDIALQCSPDHPWVREHPAWFRQRPDGTIKHAENPPKQYQDIYPLDFESEDWRGLWRATRDVFLFWADHGVRIFRVDNPHTKPLRFWGWLIAEIKRRHPDAVFLSEAFTRPRLMYALAKVGFDQSYTYFTWRNSRAELTAYLRELTATDVAEYFRPNFFTNTPDILPEYLQFGGRPAFMARLVLAATLSASYGIYSGFEVCEGRAAQPGSEEYLDSEKYQVRRWDWSRPGNIVELVRVVNRIRRENPALLDNDSLRFHPTDNEQLICYSKSSPDGADTVLVVVNLDPHHLQHGWVELPLAELGLAADETFQVHDLIGGGRYLWRGPRNYVRLDPEAMPAQIYRLRRRVRSERDFDYFM